MGVESGLTVFFRVGAFITNINIGPLLINRKNYHKNKHVLEIILNFNISSFLNFFYCMHIIFFFFSTSQSSSWPDLVSPYSKLWYNSTPDICRCSNFYQFLLKGLYCSEIERLRCDCPPSHSCHAPKKWVIACSPVHAPWHRTSCELRAKLHKNSTHIFDQ